MGHDHLEPRIGLEHAAEDQMADRDGRGQGISDHVDEIVVREPAAVAVAARMHEDHHAELSLPRARALGVDAPALWAIFALGALPQRRAPSRAWRASTGVATTRPRAGSPTRSISISSRSASPTCGYRGIPASIWRPGTSTTTPCGRAETARCWWTAGRSSSSISTGCAALRPSSGTHRRANPARRSAASCGPRFMRPTSPPWRALKAPLLLRGGGLWIIAKKVLS